MRFNLFKKINKKWVKHLLNRTNICPYCKLRGFEIGEYRNLKVQNFQLSTKGNFYHKKKVQRAIKKSKNSRFTHFPW